MNKIIITLFAVTLPFMVFAQLKVDTNGHVGISTTATSFNSPFSVGSSGESGVTSTFMGQGTVTKIIGGTISSSSCLGSLIIDTDNNAPFVTRGIRVDVDNSANAASAYSIGAEAYVTGGWDLGFLQFIESNVHLFSLLF